MNKLYNFVVAVCGTVKLVKLTSEVFDVYKMSGIGFTKVGSLDTANSEVQLHTAGDYFVASPEGHMCLSNVAGFFLYVEATGEHPHPHDHTHGHPHQHLLPANIALKVLPDGTDVLGNPAFVLAITQAGQPVGQTLRLKVMLDTTGDVVSYEIPVE